MIKRGIKCPHCGEEIEDVTEIDVEVQMTKWDWILSAGVGLGFALLVSGVGAWSITWWGAAGVFLVSGTIAFLATRVARAKRGGADESRGQDSE